MKLKVKISLDDDSEIDSLIIRSQFQDLLDIYKIRTKIDQNLFDKFFKKVVRTHNKEVKSLQRELKLKRRRK